MPAAGACTTWRTGGMRAASSRSRARRASGTRTPSASTSETWTPLRREFLRLSGRVGERLRKHELVARTVAIKVRFSDFRTITRSRTLAEPTNVGRRLFEEAWDVFGALGLDVQQTPLRLIGVRAEQLLDAGGDALALWDPDEEWRETERTLDAVSARFGRGAIGPASLVRRSRDADEEEQDGRNPKYVSD